MRHWRAKLVFAVEATDYETARDKTFALLMRAFLAVREQGEVYIHRPVFNLTPPYTNFQELNGGPIRFPPSVEIGEKKFHQVETNILYMKAHHWLIEPSNSNPVNESEWKDWGDSTRWMYDIFHRVTAPDVRFLRAEESIVHFD